MRNARLWTAFIPVEGGVVEFWRTPRYLFHRNPYQRRTWRESRCNTPSSIARDLDWALHPRDYVDLNPYWGKQEAPNA